MGKHIDCINDAAEYASYGAYNTTTQQELDRLDEAAFDNREHVTSKGCAVAAIVGFCLLAFATVCAILFFAI